MSTLFCELLHSVQLVYWSRVDTHDPSLGDTLRVLFGRLNQSVAQWFSGIRVWTFTRHINTIPGSSDSLVVGSHKLPQIGLALCTVPCISATDTTPQSHKCAIPLFCGRSFVRTISYIGKYLSSVALLFCISLGAFATGTDAVPFHSK